MFFSKNNKKDNKLFLKKSKNRYHNLFNYDYFRLFSFCNLLEKENIWALLDSVLVIKNMLFIVKKQTNKEIQFFVKLSKKILTLKKL